MTALDTIEPQIGAPQDARPMRPFFILWIGQALSFLGSQTVQFAIIWWLTAETGSATVLATASFFGLLPPIIMGPFAGALVDRWNRKRVMLAADAMVAVTSLGLVVLFAMDLASIGAVFAALLIRAIGATFHSPAMLASTTLMVPERHLTRIQGINQMLEGGMLVIAASLGSLLVATLSMKGIMLVDVFTALIAILPLLFITVPQPERTPEQTAQEEADAVGPVQRTFLNVGEGLRYLRNRPGHMGIVGIAMGVNMLLIPAFSLLPLLVSEELSGTAIDLAWINSAFGVGAIIGGILLGIWGGFKRRVVTTLVGLILMGGASLAVGIAPTVLAAVAAMFAVRVIVTLVNGPIQAVLQATVAPDFQGRIFTLVGSLAGITAPVGLLLAAPIAELVGVRAWYIAGATACFLMGAIGFALPAVLKIEDEPPTETPAVVLPEVPST
ncbi:MFS transporter [uncultured Microbulbifer sp.]|uniref:MFS transporter n=1 Tax=uncultured Microbulbifer sp. TaxID=348147 RepID=UPI00262989CD|nr:MFS transporter [uncultured Microbulbifer sp.]